VERSTHKAVEADGRPQTAAHRLTARRSADEPEERYEWSRNMCYASCMLATKQRVRDLLERLPDDCSLDDVVYHLYVIQKIEAGLADAEAGRLIPHDVVAAELRRKWSAGSEL
jgi:hypothetical protein